jgi:hypothetical protein
MGETLFAAPKRRKGSAEALLDKTLRAWHEDGYLSGDGYSSARGVLRDMARAVDRAREDMYAGEGSAYSLARCNALFLEAMNTYRGVETTTHDDLDALIANISGPTILHGPDAH